MQSVHFSELFKHIIYTKSFLSVPHKNIFIKAVCIGLTLQPIFTLKLNNKYDIKSIMLKIEINMKPVGPRHSERFGLDMLKQKKASGQMMNLTETASRPGPAFIKLLQVRFWTWVKDMKNAFTLLSTYHLNHSQAYEWRTEHLLQMKIFDLHHLSVY